MNTNSKIEHIEKLGQFLESLEGKLIRVTESISIDKQRGFDRHTTTVSYFEFKVLHSGWQMSGGHLHVYGDSAKYAIFSNALESVKVIEGGVTVIEMLAQNALRKTEFTVL